MDTWFVTYKDAKGEDACKRFHTERQFWEWLSKYRGEHGDYPPWFCVYTGECVFDGS